MKCKIVGLIMLAGILIALQPISAIEIEDQVISIGGKSGNSDSHSLRSTVGQTAIGTGNSSGYTLSHGFLRKTGGESAYICGDSNGDKSVNVADAVWIINYVFAGGDPPDPLKAGDANCDGTCNIADAVWIINYIFAGGYEPCDTGGDGLPDC